MSQPIVGRGPERSLIAEWLTGGEAATSAIVLTGPAGAGKTALWDWTVATASATVLASRAGLAEAHLPWVCLADLLSSVPPEAIDALPGPQRHTLRVVMLLDDGDETVDTRAVGTGVRTLLERTASERPLLLAIDDLQNVDQPSAAALTFALRRLQGSVPIRIIGTSRSLDPPWTLLDALDDQRCRSVEVGPMTVAATYELLHQHLDLRLPRPMLLRVHETSAGNPLYALELARALSRSDAEPLPGLPLPVPAGLDALIGDRIHSQPDNVRILVAGTAAAWRFTDAGVDPDVLRTALDAGLVTAEPAADGVRVIRAAHPLIGAAAYASIGADDRQAVHERLASFAGDPVERARHTALAGSAAHGDVARTLDDGVLAAMAAGTPEIAVELARLAVDRTGDEEARADRLDRLAQALSRAGDSHGAVAAARSAVAATPAGPARAIRSVRLAEMVYGASGESGVIGMLNDALLEAAGDPTAMVEVLSPLTMLTRDIAAAVKHANRAVALLDRIDDPDPRLVVGALGIAAGMKFRAGDGLDHDAFERIIELERDRPKRRMADRADAGYAALLKYADDLPEAVDRLRKLLDEAEASGDLEAISYLLGHLSQARLWQGQLDDAQAYAEWQLDLAEQAGLAMDASTARYNLGMTMFYRGDHDDAATLITTTIEEENADDWNRQRGAGALGAIALARGDAEQAVAHLSEWHATLRDMRFREPGYSRFHLDFVEALVSTGRLSEAEKFLDELDDQVRTSGRRWAAAVATTGRALVRAARGELEPAAVEIQVALGYFETSPFLLDAARTRLLAGRIFWRSRARRTARDLIAAAVADFAAYGAVAWAARGAAELGRMSLRPRAPSDLTETEHRIAEMAAAGMTSRAIGEKLFLATKTIEANLSRAYRKLGIRTRAELGARLERMQ
ncbi:MAG TPA: AAA family ATPase [Micromonosporaceae bacterium]